MRGGWLARRQTDKSANAIHRSRGVAVLALHDHAADRHLAAATPQRSATGGLALQEGKAVPRKLTDNTIMAAMTSNKAKPRIRCMEMRKRGEAMVLMGKLTSM